MRTILITPLFETSCPYRGVNFDQSLLMAKSKCLFNTFRNCLFIRAEILIYQLFPIRNCHSNGILTYRSNQICFLLLLDRILLLTQGIYQGVIEVAQLMVDKNWIHNCFLYHGSDKTTITVFSFYNEVKLVIFYFC